MPHDRLPQPDADYAAGRLGGEVRGRLGVLDIPRGDVVTARASAARTAQVRRLQAMAELVVATLGAVLLARADEQAALLRQCATNADGIAEELAQMSGGAA